MTHLERLNPWCIVRLCPDMDSKIVGRFRRRTDAEGHLQVLKRLMPTVPYEVMFDATLERTDIQDRHQPFQS